jgi:type IV secretory pathway TraG/TraD family ATPase VirD4
LILATGLRTDEKGDLDRFLSPAVSKKEMENSDRKASLDEIGWRSKSHWSDASRSLLVRPIGSQLAEETKTKNERAQWSRR